MIRDLVHTRGGKCVIGLEDHKDGGKHYHVYAVATENEKGKQPMFSTRGARAWDLAGYHPNIQPVKAGHTKTWKYCRKENNVVCDEIPEPHDPMARRKKVDEVFSSALASCNDHRSFLEDVRTNGPGVFFKNFNSIDAAARFCYQKDNQVQIDDPACTLLLDTYPEIQDWITTELPDPLWSADLQQPTISGGIQETESSLASEPPESVFSCGGGGSTRQSTPLESWSSPGSTAFKETERYGSSPPLEARANKRQARVKSLILWGPSKVGKSMGARKFPGRYCLMSGKFNLRELDDKCDYLIMDDFDKGFRGFDYKLWFQGAPIIDCTDKYMPTTRIKWGRPCVFICNRNPLETAPREIEREWIEANCVIVHVDRPLIDIAQ